MFLMLSTTLLLSSDLVFVHLHHSRTSERWETCVLLFFHGSVIQLKKRKIYIYFTVIKDLDLITLKRYESVISSIYNVAYLFLEMTTVVQLRLINLGYKLNYCPPFSISVKFRLNFLGVPHGTV